MTTVALLGTLASLALTALLATVFVGLASFSGFASEEAGLLAATSGAIDLRGLLLALVVIGALGALDDMTVTQASAVWELRNANPELAWQQLFGSAMRIGRDHVASTVNTLVLAYAGASMPPLVLFVLSGQSFATVVNSGVVAHGDRGHAGRLDRPGGLGAADDVVGDGDRRRLPLVPPPGKRLIAELGFPLLDGGRHHFFRWRGRTWCRRGPAPGESGVGQWA